MTNQFSEIKWVRVILTTLVVYILGFVTIFAVVTAYASYLGFQARGVPDPTMIDAFANQYAPWIGSGSLILFTFLGARHVAKRVDTAHALHGIILGALAGLVNLLFDGFVVSALITAALTTAAGWLGARK